MFQTFTYCTSSYPFEENGTHWKILVIACYNASLSTRPFIVCFERLYYIGITKFKEETET